MSNSELKYIEYKMKYLNLRNKLNASLIGGGDKQLIYSKKIKNTPPEYLQNILFIELTKQNLSLKDTYINYVPDPVEQNTSQPKTINVEVYNLKNTVDDNKIAVIKKILDKRLEQLSMVRA
jgi:hypothetical protein